MPRPFDLKPGYYHFVINFSWDFSEDAEALQKLNQIFDQLPEGIDRTSIQSFYLTGARTLLFVGATKSALSLQTLCASVTFKSAIRADVYHAVEVHEVRKMMKETPAGKRRKA
ncbi:MAG: hypothetical protein MUF69_04260 [Desulfobacterota bacterium]|jgi:hypothetical protein|nr:hypothetical protein [Thermodesulfobacteriota bacterium]